MRKIRGTLCVSWPRHGVSVVAMVMSLLQRNVLHGFDLSSIGDSMDESSRFSSIKNYPFDSDMYT
jgi:hypothetical protein